MRQQRGYFLFVREGVPKNWDIVSERIKKVFDSFMNSTVKSGGMEELRFGGVLRLVFI